jgi:radical SAM protein with 4Fe4S-binding SPASM domain
MGYRRAETHNNSTVAKTITPPIGATPSAQPRLVRQPHPEELENPHPLYCVWEITLKCDLGCKHCGSRAGPERTTELTTKECLDVVHQMAELEFREVTLIGGEAYLREDWDVIAAEITKHGMSCGMTTGARGFDEERLKRAVDAGIKSISVSIDGLEATHNAQRGVKDSWRNAVDSAERIAKTNIRLSNNTQINRLSMPELPALADMLINFGCEAWQIQLTVPMGNAADRMDLLLQPYELLNLFPLLVWIKENKLEAAGITLFPGNNIGYFGPFESLLRYNGKTGAHWGGCPAGAWSIGLEADGKIKGCPSLPSGSYTGGNTKTDRLADVLQHAKPVTFIRERTHRDLWGFCGSCYYADICKAGCTWTSQVFMGRPGNNPYCIHRAIEHEKSGQRERFERISEAPGLPFDQGRFALITEEIPNITSSTTVCGFSFEEVLALDWTKSSGIWPAEKLRSILQPDKSRLPIL